MLSNVIKIFDKVKGDCEHGFNPPRTSLCFANNSVCQVSPVRFLTVSMGLIITKEVPISLGTIVKLGSCPNFEDLFCLKEVLIIKRILSYPPNFSFFFTESYSITI